MLKIVKMGRVTLISAHFLHYFTFPFLARIMLPKVQDCRQNTDAKVAFSYFNREFKLYYQPVVDLENWKLNSLETLAHWQPERAQLYVSNLYDLVEHSQLDLLFHQWVLYESCQQMQFWQDNCLSDIPLILSVNLSPKQLFCHDLVEFIEQMLDEIGLVPMRLQLEIPAAAIAQNWSESKSMIARLKETGVSICIDDFESFHLFSDYLCALSVDALKTSRTYIEQLTYDHHLILLFERMIGAAHDTQTQVIAKGIETAEQLTTVRAMGCLYGQGCLFSHPLVSHEATTFIALQVKQQPKELSTFLVAMNILSRFAQNLLGHVLVTRYWQETKPQKAWLMKLEPYHDRTLLWQSTQSMMLDVTQQEDLRQWVHDFVQRCDRVIKDFRELLAQANFNATEAQLLRVLWLVCC